MVTEPLKRLLGTTSIYYTLDIASGIDRPPFLKRNIYQVLNSHAADIALQKSGQTPRNIETPIQSNRDLFDSMPRDGKDGRQAPFPEMLSTLAANRKPLLRILPKEIRIEGIDYTSDVETANDDDTPAWVPNTRAPTFKCDFSYRLSRKDGNNFSSVASDSQPMTVACHTDKDGNKRFTLHVDQPFLVPPHKLFVKVDSGASPNGKRRWKRTTLSQYQLKLFIKCHNVEDSSELLSLLSGKSDSSQMHAESCELRSHWKHFPRCPPEDSLLHLFCGSKDETETLKYKLNVELNWTEEKASRLATINNMVRAQVAKKESGHPKASGEAIQITKETPAVLPAHKISYVFFGANGEARTRVANDFKCLLCKSRLPHSSFDRLHFHYLTNHDHFKFVVKSRQDLGGVVQKTIEVDLAERVPQRASNHVSDEVEMHWARPLRPFDLIRYLKGDDSWITDRPPTRRPRARDPIDESGTRSPAPFRRVVAPEDVRPRPTKKRKRFAVPHVPGVTLYRNVSKRVAQPGEELSESDDDIDQEWFDRQQLLRRIDGLPKATQDFLKLYDRHMEDENINGDLYLADALVRLCNLYAEELRKPLVMQEFKVKLEQLYRSGLIPEQIYGYCLDRVHNRGPNAGKEKTNPSSNSTASPDKDEEGDHTMEDAGKEQDISDAAYTTATELVEDIVGPAVYSGTYNGSDASFKDLLVRLTVDAGPDQAKQLLECALEVITMTPKASESLEAFRAGLRDYLEKTRGVGTGENVPVRSTQAAAACLCGQIVQGAVRKAIYCAEPTCRQGAFHLACVGLSKRVPEWKCSSCAGRQTE